MLTPRNSFLIFFFWLCFDCNAISMTKRANFDFGLCFPFFIASLTLANVGIKRSFLHVLTYLKRVCTFNICDWSFLYFLTTFKIFCSCFFLVSLKTSFPAYNLMMNSITRRLNRVAILTKNKDRNKTFVDETIYSAYTYQDAIFKVNKVKEVAKICIKIMFKIW